MEKRYKKEMITILATIDDKELTRSMRESLSRFLAGDDMLPPNIPVKIYKDDTYE